LLRELSGDPCLGARNVRIAKNLQEYSEVSSPPAWRQPLYITIKNGMQIRVKINIVNERGEPFMGPGVRDLLEQIRRYKSINCAAEQMSLSYVKALNLLNRLEADLGRRILIRKRGGNERGGSELAPFGEKYIVEYSRLEKRVQRRVEEEFRIFRRRVGEAESGASS
jgi:molybdate transport system regulatory protein